MHLFPLSNKNNQRFNLFKKIAFSLCISSLIACGSSGDNDAPSDPTGPTTSTIEVTTSLGAVTTTHSSDENMISFKGIPYAQPPVGDLRFADPVAVTEYTTPVDATEFGSNCPQNESSIENGSTNEDCLFINVYTPDVEGDYPVLLWIHGGAFVSGAGSQAYDAQRLVEQDVVVVTFNYRLGAFGFMSFDGVDDGNWGLKDQHEAMRWVKNHISNFGGDASNITLFGESAGGHSVMSQLAVPTSESEALFQKAIVQSGHFYADQWSQTTSDTIGGAIAAAVKAATECADDAATCIRNASVETILEAQTTVLDANTSGSYYPTIDGTFLTGSFKSIITAGNHHKVPMLTGSNSEEGTFFTMLDELLKSQVLVDEAKYDTAVSALLTPIGLDAAAIADEYLTKQDPESEHRFSIAYSAIQTDFLFACPSHDFAELFSAHTDTYMYRFSDQNAPNLFVNYVPFLSGFPVGAAHGFDVQYVLGTEEEMRNRGGGDAQIELSDAMIQYWTQFAKEGSPNATGTSLPNWAKYDATQEDPTYLELTTPSISEGNTSDFETSHSCAYWENPPLAI